MVAATGFANTSSLAAMFPAEIQGWKPAESDAIYDSETLFKYINGGAEIYRSFNVQTVLARRYTKNGEPDIIADLFDMGSSEDAYGIYYHDLREGSEAGIGQGSELMESSLFFWKGRYFVSVMALGESKDTRGAVLDLGKAMAQAITDEGNEPDLLRLLPEKERLANQVYYFHDHHCLNAHYSLSGENLLDLSRQTEGILARYKPASAINSQADTLTFALLLIRYTTIAEAQKGYENFRLRYLTDADSQGMARTENSNWNAARLKDRILVAVLEAPSKGEIQRIISEVEKARIK